MTTATPSSLLVKVLVVITFFCAIIVSAWWFLDHRETGPRGEALGVALRSAIDKPNTDQALVAKAILDNYHETRSNASGWSVVYWGCIFVAAVLSALSALILKLETFQNEKMKKDIAALFSVTAALLITISTSGDFQRKWQANRIAAAELESTGYDFLEKGGANARAYLASVRQILLARHMAIVGSSDQRGAASEPTEASEAPAQKK